jgi:hypothetical protein
MFETRPMEMIALIAVVLLLVVGLVLAAVASWRKRRQLQALSRSSDFAAVYEHEPRKGATTGPQ